jgi:hypothetical protein
MRMGAYSEDTRSGSARGCVVFLFRVAESIQEGSFFFPKHDINAFPTANFLAQPATNTRFLVDDYLAQKIGIIPGSGIQRIERTNIDTNPTSVAVIRMHDGYRSLGLLQNLGHVPERVENGFIGADYAASAAIDAHRSLDQIRFFRIARNSSGRASLLAGAATSTIFGDDREGHRSVSFS